MNTEQKAPSPARKIYTQGALVLLGVLATLLLVVITASLSAPRETAARALSLTKSARLALALGQGESTVYSDIGSQYFGGILPYDVVRAKHYFEKAVELDLQNYEAQYQLARIAFVEGRITDAQERIEKNIELAPNFDQNYYMQGLIYSYAENYTKAEAGFTEFIKRRPDMWGGYVDLSLVFFAQRKYREGLILLDYIADKAKGVPWVENAHGLLLLYNGEYERAYQEFLNAKASLAAMTPEEFDVAYQENNPLSHEAGYEDMRESIESNLSLIEARMKQ